MADVDGMRVEVPKRTWRYGFEEDEDEDEEVASEADEAPVEIPYDIDI